MSERQSSFGSCFGGTLGIIFALAFAFIVLPMKRQPLS